MIVAKIGFSPVCGLVIIVYHVLIMGGSLLLEQKPSLNCGQKGCQQASLVTLRDRPTLLQVKKMQYACLVCARPLLDGQHQGLWVGWGENEQTNEWLSKLGGVLGIECTDISTC